MTHQLVFSEEATQDLSLLSPPSFKKQLKAVHKALALLEMNPRYPGLRSHKHHTLSKQRGYEIFEVYAENRTPGAYRIFWRYGPQEGIITILTITSHP